MAITVRKNRRTGEVVGYQAQIRLSDEKSVSKTFSSYAEAEEFEKNASAAIRSSRGKKARRDGLVRAAKPGVAAFSSELVTDVLAAFSDGEPDHYYRKHVARVSETVVGVRVCDLNEQWNKGWCARLRKTSNLRGGTLSEVTIAHYIKVLRQACLWRAKKLRIECPDLGLTYRELEAGWDDGRERRLRGNEEAWIRAQLGRHGCRRRRGEHFDGEHPAADRQEGRYYQLLFDFALETAARLSEMVNLPWRELDLDEGIWRLPGKRCKNGRKRDIVLTPRAMRIVLELRASRDASSQRVFHALPSAKSVGQLFARTVRRLGIDDLRFHDLRHEAISRLWLSGAIEPGALMKMVGHSSMQMSMRYFNPTPQEIRKRMWSVLGSSEFQPDAVSTGYRPGIIQEARS